MQIRTTIAATCIFAQTHNPAGFDPSRPDDKRKRQEGAHRKRLMEAERRRRDELRRIRRTEEMMRLDSRLREAELQRLEEEEEARRYRLDRFMDRLFERGGVDTMDVSSPKPPLEYVYVTPSRDELEGEGTHLQSSAPVRTPSPGAPRPIVGPAATPSHETKPWPALPFEALGANDHEKYPAEQTQAECMAMDTEDEDASAPPHIIAAEIASDDDGDEDLASLWQVLGQAPGIEPNVSFEANEVAFDLDRMEKR